MAILAVEIIRDRPQLSRWGRNKPSKVTATTLAMEPSPTPSRIRADVLTDGEVSVGDPIHILPEEWSAT